jgi:hypothetical protein
MNNCALPNCYPASYDINEGFDDVPAPINNRNEVQNVDPKELARTYANYGLASSHSAQKSADAPRCGIPGKQDPRLFEEDQEAGPEENKFYSSWVNFSEKNLPGPALEPSLVLTQGTAFHNYPQTAPPLQRGDAKASAKALLQKCPDGYNDVKMGSACQSKDDFFFKDGYMNENFENAKPTPTTKRHSVAEEKDWKRRSFSEDGEKKHKHTLIPGIPNIYLYIGIGIFLILILIYYNFM